MEPLLQLDGVWCAYDDSTVVEDLSFHINKGDIACLLGPSGCGKTTTLRSIAGFESITRGSIKLDGMQVSAPKLLVPPEKRNLGMVFQDYALFPHLTIQENVCFGLRRASASKRKSVAAKMLELVGLEQYATRYPHEISGGQQQRVALARAMAPEPSLILLDEPFSNLDVDLRRRLSLEVRDILKSLGTTALLVTHDQEEAFAVADRIGVMNEGKLQQWDSAYNIYHEPLNRFVANFIGLGHFIRGNRAYQWVPESPVDILLRPDDILPDPDSPLQAKVLQKTFTGASMLFKLQLPTGSIVEAIFPSHNDHEIGTMVGIRLEADHLVAFSSPTP